jgi:hypothetical protein
LEYYGRSGDESLIALTREIQWPDLEEGARLDRIDAALKKRGIYTYGLQVTPRARLVWPHPVLVHLTAEGTSSGHFVVWLPTSSGARVDLWRGLQGVKEESVRELAEERSGAVLLTSPEPIVAPDMAVSETDPLAWFWWMVLVFAATAVAVFFVEWYRPWFPLARFRKGAIR